MKRLILVVVVALALAGCDTASNNSDYYSKDRNRTSDTDILSENDVRLIDIQVDGRDFSTTEISTCPVATQVGTGSCNAVTP